MTGLLSRQHPVRRNRISLLRACAARRRRPSGESGFTLLEILVVLLIVGVIVSFATLSSGIAGRDKQVEDEVQRLIALMGLAAEEAVLQTRQFAVEFGPQEYRFLRYEEGQWAPVIDEVLRPRPLPAELGVDLALEGRPIVLEAPPPEDGEDENKEEKNDADAKPKAANPQVIFLSSGEATPFELTLEDRVSDKRYVIKGDAVGNIALQDDEQSR